MTSDQHGSYTWGYKRDTMGHTMSSDAARLSKSLKVLLSSDWRLQLASMKLESLVIVDQNATVNTFLGLVLTACQVMEVGGARSNLS